MPMDQSALIIFKSGKKIINSVFSSVSMAIFLFHSNIHATWRESVTVCADVC